MKAISKATLKIPTHQIKEMAIRPLSHSTYPWLLCNAATNTIFSHRELMALTATSPLKTFKITAVAKLFKTMLVNCAKQDGN